MAKSKDEITADILGYIQRNGGSPSAWYVGITDDAHRRLFQEHYVNNEKGVWIYRQAYSSDSARDVEDHFIYIIGTDGGTGGGNDNSDTVYAYKKASHTDP